MHARFRLGSIHLVLGAICSVELLHIPLIWTKQDLGNHLPNNRSTGFLLARTRIWNIGTLLLHIGPAINHAHSISATSQRILWFQILWIRVFVLTYIVGNLQYCPIDREPLEVNLFQTPGLTIRGWFDTLLGYTHWFNVDLINLWSGVWLKASSWLKRTPSCPIAHPIRIQK